MAVTWAQRRAEFHLRGTPDDHDQSTHGGGGGGSDDDYHGGHRPTDTGPRVHDLLESEATDGLDVYGEPRFFTGYPGPELAETVRQLRAVRGKPDAPVTIYRAAPRGAEIREGDWVTLSKRYAQTHADSGNAGDDAVILERQVPAKEVRWAVDDLMEYGWFPSTADQHKSMLAADTETFHLRGQHDQKTHGNRGGGSSVGKTHDEIELQPWQSDWKPYTDAQSDRPVFWDGDFLAVPAANGNMIEVKFDVSVSFDRRNDPVVIQRAVDMVNGATTGYDMAPLPDGALPQVLVISDGRIPAPAAVNHGGEFYGMNQILLNDYDGPTARDQWDEFDAYPIPTDHPQIHPAYFMPVVSGGDVTFGEYTGAHEYGHVRAALRADNRDMLTDLDPRVERAAQDNIDDISIYGRTSPVESHAEAFAEWSLSGGRTTNRFAQAYADIFGWGDEEERALAASAGRIEMPDLDDIEFVCDSPFDGPSYVLADGTTVIGQVEEFHLAGTQYDHDQSTHAGGRRIAPVSGETVKQSIDTDLTMGALPSKIQVKVAKQFSSSLQVKPDVAREHLIDLAEAALDKGLPGRDWYQEAHDEIAAHADQHGVDPEVALAMTAALSPGTPWDENVRNAKAIMEAMSERDAVVDPDHIRNTNVWANRPDGSTGERNSAERVRPDDTFNTLYARDPKLAAVYLAKRINASVGYSYDNFFKATDLMVANDPSTIDDTLNGAKVRSFYNNLVRPQATDGDVTVDVHMQRAMANDTSSTTPQQKYDRSTSIKKKSSSITGSPSYLGAQLGAMPLMADIVREATAEFNARHGQNLKPHEFQAVVWVEQINQYPAWRMTQILKGNEL